MKYLHIIVPACALLTLAGCSSTARVAADESILDVIDASRATPLHTTTRCPPNLVDYCIQDGASRTECTCLDAYDIQSRVGRFWPRN